MQAGAEGPPAAGPRLRALALAIAAFVTFVVLGADVRTNGEPAWLWGWEQTLVNHSTLVAWWLTWSCYPYVLGPIGIGLLVLAWRARAWRVRILLSVLCLLLCWRAADLFQRIFARPRRLDWVVHHERSFSYPSSHAAIAVGFYALWAIMLASPELPRPVRRLAPALLLLLVAAIGWSRLALGAHYLT
ncbi:MAG TPA: phosphatase PAP2 family protein, partial [Verrucomicrobiae bacterium]|nr:phosphatase PAP2 family protein [Verrucomicrobiae bacterium]